MAPSILESQSATASLNSYSSISLFGLFPPLHIVLSTMSETTPESEQIAVVTHISSSPGPRESADSGLSTASQCGATTSAVNSKTDTTLDNTLDEQKITDPTWKHKGQYRLLSRADDERSLDGLKNSCQFNWRFAHYEGPVLRLRLWPEDERENSACETLDIPRVADGITCTNSSVDKLRERIQKHWTTSIAGWQLLEDRAIQYYPRNMESNIWSFDSSAPHAAGKICMITDCMDKFASFGVGLDHGRSKTMDLDTLILLARCFFGSKLGHGLWYHVPERFALQHFILTFSDLYHPLAEPSLEGLLLKRQVAKIGRLTHSKNGDHDRSSRNKELADQYFRERVLSVPLTMCSGDGEIFNLIVLGDKGAPLDATRHDAFCSCENKLRMGPEGLETWHRGWSATLDAIDDIVGFTMDHTFNDELSESYMFDSSSSMDLSKRYFTTLQLLRIARQRINDNIAEWKVSVALWMVMAARNGHFQRTLFRGMIWGTQHRA
ncbi:hypothetical protein LA080_009272 [Diaporthe eres]|nr:hypothetical protein LA080_009272 [Diaporthe eres]